LFKKQQLIYNNYFWTWSFRRPKKTRKEKIISKIICKTFTIIIFGHGNFIVLKNPNKDDFKVTKINNFFSITIFWTLTFGRPKNKNRIDRLIEMKIKFEI
jgi:hypothetical protein